MPEPPDCEPITYTEEERAAVAAADAVYRREHMRPLCPLCQAEGHGFGLGEHCAVNGRAHVVTWRCDRGHVLSCAQLLRVLDA